MRRRTSEVQKHECLQNEVSELCKTQSLQHFYGGNSGLSTKMEKEREKMRAEAPFFYTTNTQKFSVRVHGIYGKKLNCIDSLQHRRVLRERVVFALLHRLRGQIVEEAVSPLKLFHRGWEVRNRVRVR